jgi:hypothetical protein
MRSVVYVLALVIGFGMSIATLSPVAAAGETVGPVAFEIHKASCPIDYEGGIYEACHDNALEGVPFTIQGEGLDATELVTDASGVANTMILDGVQEATAVTLSENPAFLSAIGGYAYCKDQISGLVLWDATVPEDGTIVLGSVTADQFVICDWYNYAPAGLSVVAVG